ncbi:S-layer homology domain-containing protein [Ureibacillus sp. FSL K6-3587]|uniref:S-layer homology domain-containing protein n=1 Tax=Ureibacillus sp. FSL K6-3587 TaxID=2954681 RepID=UPI003158F939
MANQPKNYKKFVATAATATLVASAIVPVASAASFSDIEGNTHADAIKALSDAGIIKGYEDGTFKPNAEINRGQTVKLLGRWLETKGYKVPENWNTVQRFNDLPVNAADSELVKYAALVKDAGVFNGSNGNLNYNQPMQRQQMALVLVRAIKTVEGIDLIKEYKDAGYTSKIKDLDKAYSTENVEAITALEYAGITVVENFNPTSAITRGQFASFLNRTINYEAPVKEAKVVSVNVINAKQIQINFSKEVDSDTAKNLGNYYIKNASQARQAVSTTDSTAKVSVSDDKKSVTITASTTIEALAKVTQSGTPFVFEVDGVKATDGSAFPKYTAELKVDDKVAPTLVSAEAKAITTTKNVTLNFSEPVDPATGVYKVNGKVASVTAGSEPNQLTLTTVDSLEAGKSYTLEIINAKDYAGNIINPVSTNFTVVKDDAAPTISTVTTISDNKVRVTFDKSMNASTLASSNITVVRGNGVSVSVGDYRVSAVSNTSNKTFDITFTGGLYSGVDSEALTLVFSSNIKDSVGNVLPTTTKTVTLNKDTQAPTIQAVRVLPKGDTYDGNTYANGALVLTFNEDVVDPGTSILAGSSVTIIDQDGTDISSNVTPGDPVLDSKNSKILVIPFTTNTIPTTSKSATVRISAGITTDASLGANKNAGATFNNVKLDESITDTTKPVVSNVAGNNTNNTISFTITEQNLDKSTVQNIDNYRLDGKPLPSDSYVTISGTAPNYTVTIHLGDEAVSETRTNYAFTISGVKDTFGNIADTVAVNNVSLKDNVKPVLNVAKINSDNTITLSFTESVSGVVKGDFEFYLNGLGTPLNTNSYTVTPVTAGSDAGSVLVDFVLSFDSGTALAGDEKLYVDVDGDGLYSATVDILLLQGTFADKAAAEAVYGSSKVALADLSSIKVKTASSTTGADAAGNKIKSGTLITVK